jgi:HEAT repeat protein
MSKAPDKCFITWKPWIYVLAAVLLSLGALLLLVRRADPYFNRVRTLVAQLGPYRSYQEPEVSKLRELSNLGSKAYPALARLLRRRDTKIDELYDRCRARLPNSVRSILPARQSKNQLRWRAKVAVVQLGPVASRALVGAIHDALRNPDQDSVGNLELLRCLYWSIPDSALAVATLRDWLRNADPHRMLFGMKDADEIWPHVPELAPLLIPWLRQADHVRDAAQGLGAMGSNAVSAIPDLVAAFEHGVAGFPPNTNFVVRYAAGSDPLTWNRAAAIEALGHLGASPDILKAFERGLSDPYPMVQALAADGIGKLGPKGLPLLPTLLANLNTTNRLVLEYEIEAIGKMGPGAHQAIPVLRRWADPKATASLPPPQGLGRVVRWFDDPLPLPGCAAVALVQVAPEEAKGLGGLIAEALTPGPQNQGGYSSPEKLRQLQPLAGEIVRALEPALADNRQWVKQLTAMQILCLDPEHGQAKAVLSAAMQQPEPSLRTQAAIYFWRVTGETNQVLQVIRETLKTVKDNASQPPVNYAAELGPLAKPFVPQIQGLLTNDDWSIRQLAGKALRQIDPKALPPINERYL